MSKVIYYNKPVNNPEYGTGMVIEKPIDATVGDTIKISNGGIYSGKHELKWKTTGGQGNTWLFIDKPFVNVGQKNKEGIPIDRSSGGTVAVYDNVLAYFVYGLAGLILVTVIVVIIKKKKG